jgi:pimeloyl-ACP methyl ester carboxylesterase
MIPDAKIYIFPQGGHSAILTNAEAFAQLIQDFLRSDTPDHQ